jgi:hypothetical protein
MAVRSVASIAADAGKRGPSRAWYLVSGAIVIATIAIFAYVLSSRLSALTDQLMQLMVPGQVDLNLVQTGTYSIFHERQSVIDGQLLHSNDIAGLRVSVRSASNTDVPLAMPKASATYSIGGRSGVAIFEFVIREPGTYRLNAEYDGGRALPRAVLTIGLDFVGELTATILGSIAIMFAGLIGAAALAVVVFVKRRRARLPSAPARPDPL